MEGGGVARPKRELKCKHPFPSLPVATAKNTGTVYVLVTRNGTLFARERRQNPLDKQTQFKTSLASPYVHYNCYQVTFPLVQKNIPQSNIYSTFGTCLVVLTDLPVVDLSTFLPMKKVFLRYRSDNAMVYWPKEGVSDRPYLQYNVPLLSNEAWKVRKKM